MVKVALKGLAGRKLRALLTALATILGVAMVSGTFVLTDTIKAGFSQIYTTVYKNTDAVITGRSAIGTSGSNGTSIAPPSFSATLLTKVKALPGVADAAGGIGDLAQLVGKDGKVLAVGGAPGLAYSVDPTGDQHFNPLTLTAGRWAAGPHEVVIDAHTASAHHFAVGDEIGVVARGAEQKFRITGLTKLGGSTSIGGATIAVFDPATAGRLFDKVGKLDEIDVSSKPNVSTAELLKEIRAVLPPATQVRSGAGQAAQASKDVSTFTSIIQDFLLAFGGIALFVGTFVIANTLSITIAQRAREFGTLRTIGATRRQILASVLVEGFIVGLIASVIGLFLGLLLARGLDQLFKAFGADLPQAGTVFATRTIVLSLVVGTVVTLLASLFPAFRATRVEPIAAVREGVLPPSRLARFGTPAALVTLAIGLALVLFGALDKSPSSLMRLLAVGLGVVALFIGMALIAPKFVPTLARVLGWPGARAGGAPGGLAQENTMRNPARTASTAAALMIGLALVTAVGVLAAGIKSSFESSVSKQFLGDYALTSSDGFTPTGIAAEAAVRTVPAAEVVSGVRAASVRVFGHTANLTGVAPNVGRVIKITWVEGGPQVPGTLGSDGALVDTSYAKKHHLSLGSPVMFETAAGRFVHLKIAGIFKAPKGGSPFGDVTISTALFDRTFSNPQDVFAFVLARGGVTDANTAAFKTALGGFPDAKIQTESQFIKQQESGINQLLVLLYVLLSLSIVVSLFGIVNTMVLTVFERTRELGMLRAVGMTRRQTRRMIRYEAVTTALIGACLGIPLGVGLALLISEAIGFFVFALPLGTLVGFVIAAVLVGLFAAIFPARRAARLNVLAALQYE